MKRQSEKNNVKLKAIRFAQHVMLINAVSIKNEARIECFKGHGPGGQHRNKTFSCVRLIHEPSNTTVIATEFRSQFRNKALAFERLQEKLRKLNVIKKLRLPTQKPAHIKAKMMEDKKVRSRKILLRKIDSIF